jgi:hypothetical protein
VKHERIYLGGTEIYREYNGDDLHNERYSQHVSDGAGNSALIEVQTLNDGNASTATRYRYQYSNHLGSAALELNESKDLISYGVIA